MIPDVEEQLLYEERYWFSVKECLVRFLGLSPRSAKKEADTFRKTMRQKIRSHGGDPDLIYHEEPYRIACDIAGANIDITRWSEYQSLMRQVFPDALIYSETNSETRKSIPRKASGIKVRYSQVSISKPSGETNIKKKSGKAGGNRAGGADKSSPGRAKKITGRAAG